MLGPPLAVPVAKLVAPARVGEPPRRFGPLSPVRASPGGGRGQRPASPASTDRDHRRQPRASNEQDEGSCYRQDHQATERRADTWADGKTGLYALGLPLCPELKPAGLLDLEGPDRPEVVPRFVDLEVAVPHLSPAVW